MKKVGYQLSLTILRYVKDGLKELIGRRIVYEGIVYKFLEISFEDEVAELEYINIDGYDCVVTVRLEELFETGALI